MRAIKNHIALVVGVTDFASGSVFLQMLTKKRRDGSLSVDAEFMRIGNKKKTGKK